MEFELFFILLHTVLKYFRIRKKRMKKILLMVAVAIMTALSVEAQKIQVVDASGRGIPLANVLAEDGNLIGTTDLNGSLADVKGAAKVAITHVAYKPQLVTVASLTDGRVTMEDLDYNLQEIVVKPKPYIYVETLYRVYVYRNDSLHYFMTGIMPNAYDPKKKKREHGSYYQARAEFCNKFWALWGARAQRFHAGQVRTMTLDKMEKEMKEKYFVKATVKSPTHTIYSNPKGVVGHLVRTGGQMRMTLDAGKAQMYANEAKKEKKVLKKRQEMGYDYQYTHIYANDDDGTSGFENFLMESDHWEFNDKKSHVKFFVETYATAHYYMDKEEWKARKKAVKEDYGTYMTLDQVTAYERQHKVPALSPATLQGIQRLKKQW